MTALEGLAHDFNLTDALERIIHTAVSKVDDGSDHIIRIRWIDEIRHAKFFCKRTLIGINVDSDNTVRAHNPCSLNDVKTNTSKPEHGNAGSRFDFRRIHDSPEPRGDSTSDVANLIEGRIFPDSSNCDFG